MGMNLNHGGHLTHGSPVNQSGKLYHFVPYNVGEDGFLDYDEIRKIAKECKPKMIVAGASAYPREIRFDLFADIAKKWAHTSLSIWRILQGLLQRDFTRARFHMRMWCPPRLIRH